MPLIMRAPPGPAHPEPGKVTLAPTESAAIVIDLNQIKNLDDLRNTWRERMLADFIDMYHIQAILGSALAQAIPWDDLPSVLNNQNLVAQLDRSNLELHSVPTEVALMDIENE